MRSIVMLLVIMSLATIVLGFSVRHQPALPGDVAAARWVQAHSTSTTWATLASGLATSPFKYFVMGLTIGLGFALAGWRGAVLALGAIALDQYGAESTKAIFARPRPTTHLINVVGSPTGTAFPSTTMTFFSATFGVLAILAARTKSSALRWPLLIGSVVLIAAGAAARVALGAHWPSDVIFTVALSLGWIWTASRALL